MILSGRPTSEITEEKRASEKVNYKYTLWFMKSPDSFICQELLDFLNKAPIAMHWLSATGHVLWANETELNVLGYTPEEYIGQARL